MPTSYTPIPSTAQFYLLAAARAVDANALAAGEEVQPSREHTLTTLASL